LAEDLKISPKRVPSSTHRCPFLGLVHDPDTAFSDPSQFNRCFHAKRAAKVALEHQSSFCLSSAYRKCKIYKGTLKTSSPIAIKGNHFGEAKGKWYLIGIGVTLSILYLVGLRIWLGSMAAVMGYFRDGLSNGTPSYGFTTKTPFASTSTFSLTETKGMLASANLSPTSSPTPIPPTQTATLLSTAFTPSFTPTASLTPTRYLLIPTFTPLPVNGSQPKHTPVPATNTSVPPPTNTQVPPPTNTQVPPPTNTQVPPPTNTPVPPPTAAPTDNPTQANPAP
jgi:hypothetical protein